MHSVFIVLLGIAGMCFGWFVYSRFVANRIFRLDPDFVTPAHRFNDGVDFVPTNRYVLWGHHFTSVAGAAPIVGPAIAVYWGWAPAVAWVVLGTVFFAGVHDFGALWASNRHKARSIGALSESVVGARTRKLYMVVVFLLLLMVNSVFGVIIARAFVDTPSAVFPAWAAIVVALAIGQLVHRKFNLIALTVGGVTALYVSIYVGDLMPLELPAMFGLSPQANWILILFLYAAVASMLPVWVPAAAARFHQWGATLPGPRIAVRGGAPGHARHRCASLQRPIGRERAIDRAAPVRDHRLRRGFGFSWHRRFGHHGQATRPRAGCAFRRLSRRRWRGVCWR